MTPERTLWRRKLTQKRRALINGALKAIIPTKSTMPRTEDPTFGPHGPNPTNGPTAIPSINGSMANSAPYIKGLCRKVCWMLDSNLASLLLAANS